jgi:hypothetical protein
MEQYAERKQVGEFTQTVIEALALDVEVGTPIYLGESNREHMQRSHPSDYKKYGKRLGRILSTPDYVGKMRDGSVEFIKTFGKYIKIAVRITAGGDYYARTLYHVDDKAAQRFVKSGKWKPVKIS